MYSNLHAMIRTVCVCVLESPQNNQFLVSICTNRFVDEVFNCCINAIIIQKQKPW